MIVGEKKILLICPQSRQIVTFRKKLIEKLQVKNYKISVIVFDNLFQSQIEEMGVGFYSLRDKNRSVNPLKILSLKKRYCKLIKKIAPDIVFTFMLKPNCFGVRAAKKAGVNEIYSMVEGAGDVFINNGIKWKLARLYVCSLYKSSFKYSKKVFFLNEDDKKEFVERKLVKETKCEIVHGIGVDLNKFKFAKIRNQRMFIMIARMLKTKGVFEYCKAARIVKQKYPDAIFNYVGWEGDVKIEDIKEYIDDGSVKYLGPTDNVVPYIEECTANILPSYREGFGLVNAECGAIGRATITCDTNGTRDTIVDGESGFLVPVGDYKSIADKSIWMIENPEKVEEMGLKARKLVEEKFDCEKNTDKVIEIIER